MVCLGIPKYEGLMRELKLVRSATGWLRKLGFALTSLVVAFALAFVALNGASSNANGSLSEVDYALSVTGNGVSGTYIASGGTNNFPAVSSTATWEAWINPTDTTCSIICTWIAKEAKFMFGIQNDQFAFALFDTQYRGWYYTRVRPSLNAWQHVAWVKSGTSLTLFLNGQQVYTTTNDIPATLADNSNPFGVGDRGNTERFRGQIDEVRVWNVARSQEQIAGSMHQRLVGNEGGLLGYWDFNEPSGTTVHNRVSGGTNLSLTSTWSRVDVKRVTSLAGGNTVVTFPRTYLPGAGGWLLPTNLSQMQVLVVGAGGGGGADNGGGGGGGEMRASANQSITPSTRVTVRVGQGGRAGSWARPYGSTAGEASSVVGAGMDYLAQGGLGGAGFGSLSTAGGSGGRGGTGSNGAQGGQADSYCRPNPVLRSATAGSDGPSSAIGSATSRAFGGGGGGGTGYETFNTGSSAWGLAGGQGGGGRGNNYKLNHDGSARDGASAGQE